VAGKLLFHFERTRHHQLVGPYHSFHEQTDPSLCFFFNFLTSGSTKLKIGARDKEQGQQFSQAFVL
jgi:hypothetical protein